MCTGLVSPYLLSQIVLDDKVPLELVNPSTDVKYIKIGYYGKGGYSTVYEFQNCDSNELVAVKAIAKPTESSDSLIRNKAYDEVDVHTPLNHENVVKFFGVFEDPNHVYLLIEPCRLGTLFGIISRRSILSMIETRYYIRQIAEGCKYLHENFIIHRDLKVNNVFIDQNMRVKIGDFGLAIRLKDHEQFSSVFCGTVNYVAPEVLDRRGHRYEVDCWALGCIMYILILGKAPFESPHQEVTYDLIKRAQFHAIPKNIGLWPPAIRVIHRLLRKQPLERLTMDELLNDEFLTSLPLIPRVLPLVLWRTLPGCIHKVLNNANQREQCALAEIAKFECVEGEPAEREQLPERVLSPRHPQGQSQRHTQERNVFWRWCYNCILCK